MQVHLEDLAHRVGLDEVALVVDVESVFGCVVLQVCDEACNVDYGHWRSSGSPVCCVIRQGRAIPAMVAQGSGTMVGCRTTTT